MSANTPGQPAIASGTVSMDLAVPASALAIGAHPDDVEFGGGATLAKWAAQGCVVHHLICTDGSKGTWDATANPAILATRRQAEQRQAAAVVGGEHAGEVVFLGHVDGELSSDLAVRAEVVKVIRRLRPQVVLGHDPWKRYRLHPDHRHAGLLACEGIVAARDPHFFAELGLTAHRPDALLLWEADEINHIEQVSTAHLDSKLAALEAHESQYESTMHALDEAALDTFRQNIRRGSAELGAPYGVGTIEAFHLLTDL